MQNRVSNSICQMKLHSNAFKSYFFKLVGKRLKKLVQNNATRTPQCTAQ